MKVFRPAVIGVTVLAIASFLFGPTLEALGITLTFSAMFYLFLCFAQVLHSLEEYSHPILDAYCRDPSAHDVDKFSGCKADHGSGFLHRGQHSLEHGHAFVLLAHFTRSVMVMAFRSGDGWCWSRQWSSSLRDGDQEGKVLLRVHICRSHAHNRGLSLHVPFCAHLTRDSQLLAGHQLTVGGVMSGRVYGHQPTQYLTHTSCQESSVCFPFSLRRLRRDTGPLGWVKCVCARTSRPHTSTQTTVQIMTLAPLDPLIQKYVNERRQPTVEICVEAPGALRNAGPPKV